jgi:hypothetical protein
MSVPIARIDPPSAELFRREYVRRSRPVLIQGALDQWPGRESWSIEYLRERFGERMVPVGRVSDHRLAHDGERGIEHDEVRLADYLEDIESAPSSYLMTLLHERLPELIEEAPRLPFAPPTRWSVHKLWVSHPDTRSPLHQDLPDNLYAHLSGVKQVKLYRPRDGRFMYRYPLTSRVPQVSQVDAYEPDSQRFPRFAKASPIALTLHPGDVLYIPRLWWHQFRSTTVSISVNYWWASGITAPAIYAALAYQKLRRIRY